jgi:hypothetical protein
VGQKGANDGRTSTNNHEVMPHLKKHSTLQKRLIKDFVWWNLVSLPSP